MAFLAELASRTPASRAEARLIQAATRFRRLLRNPSSLIGLIIVTTLVLVALLAPLLATHDPDAQDLAMRLSPPSAQHWLGTDQFGRDLYSRLVMAPGQRSRWCCSL